MPLKIKTKKRQLIAGGYVKELEKSVKCTIDSKCPGKWLYIDCENGHVYARTENRWIEPKPLLLKSAIMSIAKEIANQASRRII